MQNLAGNVNCDGIIQSELQRSGIDAIHGERRVSEVPASVTGKLGPFTFVRAWYYWVVNGPVPLAIARELYADPVGVSDIRVAGHCGCPAPKKPWTSLIATDGRQVIDFKEQVLLDSTYNQAEREALAQVIVYSDDPAATDAQEFVTSYHIDSEIGLRLFADTMRKHGLDKC